MIRCIPPIIALIRFGLTICDSMVPISTRTTTSATKFVT